MHPPTTFRNNHALALLLLALPGSFLPPELELLAPPPALGLDFAAGGAFFFGFLISYRVDCRLQQS
jgi:hypothetical protein